MIRIDFEGFWDGFDCMQNEFFAYLVNEGVVSIDRINPDLIIYSDYINDRSVNINRARLLYSPENIPRKNYLFKYHMNYGVESNQNFRFQNFFYYPFFYEITNDEESQYYLGLKNREKTKNINFIYSNGKALIRNKYFDYLSTYCKIDSYGKHRNNMGALPKYLDKSLLSRAIQKSELIADYKYTIAFENSRGADYISEKIWEPISVNSIPIYYGSHAVFDYFNKNKIIYIKDEKDFSKSLSLIKEINSSDKLYKEYLAEEIFASNDIKERIKYKNLSMRFVNYLENIIKDDVNINYKAFKIIKYSIKKINKKYANK